MIYGKVNVDLFKVIKRMPKYNFMPADGNEPNIYGSQRPGYPVRDVDMEKMLEWIMFMEAQKIDKIVCLLSESQLAEYEDDLLAAYDLTFGKENVCWAPVEDFHLVDTKTLNNKILPFLRDAVAEDKQVVVHCAGGIGRTGHVLAAWLVAERNMIPVEAIAAVAGVGRDAYEAVRKGNATNDELIALLKSVKK